MLALSIKNLSKTYKNGYRALAQINLDVKAGKFLALLGKNGAGKTTFVEIVSSLIRKTSGEVFVYGKDLDKEVSAVKSFIGIVPQEFNMAMFENVMQVLVTQAGYFGIERGKAERRAKKLLMDLDLWEKKDAQIIELSGGMKRRVMVARALMHDPEIIFFDEPTAGVDVQVRKKIWAIMRSLNKKGKTIILTTHYFEEAEKLCDSLAIIAKGKILLHDSLNKILKKCTKQTYLIEIESKKNLKIKSSNINILSAKKLEILVDAENTLNKSIELIIDSGAKIENIQPQHTRLEELFLNISH